MSDISTVTSSSSDSPIFRPSLRSFSARPPGRRRESVSPCSSRSTIAWWSIRRRRSALSSPVDAPLASTRNRCSTWSLTASGVVLLATAMALIGRPSAMKVSSSWSERVQVVVARLHRSHQGVDDHRVEQGAAGGDGADGVGELVALGEAVLQQVGVAGRAVGEERDGVLGVVVLAQDHDAGAGLALSDLLGRVDALALEGRRHADVADDHLGLVLGGRGQQLGMVGGLADDLDVGLAAQERVDARAHEEVVVGQHHRDHAVGHGVHPVTPDGSGRGGSHAPRGRGSPTPAMPGSPLGGVARRAEDGVSPTTARSSAMKIESRVVAVSWIPSEAVKGAMKAPFEMGIAHYDEPLPDVLGDLDDWRKRDMFRVANDLRAWIGVDDDGQITGHGYSAGGVIGSTTMGLGSANATFQAVAYPTLQPEPEVGDGWVRFQQTAGGRTGVPAPRRVAKPPFVQYHAPDRVVDPVAHDPCRRSLRVRPRRCQPVPPPLGVRP